MEEKNIAFVIGGEEILRVEQEGPVTLNGKQLIGTDPTLYSDFMKWQAMGHSRPLDPPPEDEVEPGVIKFWLEGSNDTPLIKLDLEGVHVAGAVTEDPEVILIALRQFLDTALGRPA